MKEEARKELLKRARKLLAILEREGSSPSGDAELAKRKIKKLIEELVEALKWDEHEL